jgi:hypothetical protein
MTLREYIQELTIFGDKNTDYLDLEIYSKYSDNSGVYEIEDLPVVGMVTNSNEFYENSADDINDYIESYDEEYIINAVIL